jgi:hypothetical protein
MNHECCPATYLVAASRLADRPQVGSEVVVGDPATEARVTAVLTTMLPAHRL